jgi:hypothetical protein
VICVHPQQFKTPPWLRKREPTEVIDEKYNFIYIHIVTFYNKLLSYSKKLLASHPTLTLEDHPLLP